MPPRSARRSRSTAGSKTTKGKETAGSLLRFVLTVAVIAWAFRSFVYAPFNIPSGSMLPTLYIGDYLVVSKWPYGFSRYSFPLGVPSFEGRVFNATPKRGDVVVFRLPSDPRVNYVKRVVGLPGDVVEYNRIDKRITINGEPIPIEMAGSYAEQSDTQLGWEELGEHRHRVLLIQGRISEGGKYVVPEGHYFMMGDNRDDSEDGRYPDVGFVPEGNLVGRATGIWMNWRRPSEGGPQWNRIGNGIE